MKKEWFTVEKIDNKTFAISEYGHWEEVHSYLYIGSEKAALIDTGLGIGNIKKVVDSLTSLPVIVISTHIHWDHIGGHDLFNEIAVYSDEKDWLEKGIPIPLKLIKNAIMKEPFTIDPPEEFDIDSYKVYKGKPSQTLNDYQTISLGNRKLLIIHTPGHSPGHICLYEKETGYLNTGDLLYEGLLYANYPSTDPELFYNSVKKIISSTNPKKLLPSHHKLNISLDLLSELNKLLEKLKSENKLHHGSGTHTSTNLSIIF